MSCFQKPNFLHQTRLRKDDYPQVFFWILFATTSYLLSLLSVPNTMRLLKLWRRLLILVRTRVLTWMKKYVGYVLTSNDLVRQKRETFVFLPNILSQLSVRRHYIKVSSTFSVLANWIMAILWWTLLFSLCWYKVWSRGSGVPKVRH